MNPVPYCNLCLSPGAVQYCRKDGINVVQCSNCGLIFAGEVPGIAEMKEHYSEDYFKPYIKTESVHARSRFSKRIKEIKEIRPSGALLDVGCGGGFFLKLAADEGYEVSGVELSKWASEYAAGNFSLKIYNGELKDADFPDSSFDIITLWHILEHLIDPQDFLLEVNRLLKEDGLLVVEVPNIGSAAAIVSGTDWELMSPKEHFFYFNPDTIERLLRNAGFSVFKQQSYFWTVPEMIFRDKAESAAGFRRVLLKLISFFCSIFSLLRFRVLPGFIKGDVITVYAGKYHAI